jgi:protein-tyrosine phosphatase
VIDLHCHILPGLDDGPATVDDALELARGAEADGVATIAATPHVDWSHPGVSSGVISDGVARLQERLGHEGIEVRLVPGAEVAAARGIELEDSELRALTLGGAGWLLLECPSSPTLTPGFVETARRIAWRGHRLVLAHPERCPLFHRSPELLDELVSEGMLAQVTAPAFSDYFGRTVRHLALQLLARGSVHVIASDGHDRRRPVEISRSLRDAPIDPALVRWLTQDVPTALLAGGQPPERPQTAAPRQRGRLARLVAR